MWFNQFLSESVNLSHLLEFFLFFFIIAEGHLLMQIMIHIGITFEHLIFHIEYIPFLFDIHVLIFEISQRSSGASKYKHTSAKDLFLC